MAIIALIATPLVMSIIRKARVSADKRSVDAYGRSIELAIAGYLLDNGKFPTDISQLTIEYSGDEVVCETTQINPDSSVYLAGCKVKGRDVTNYTYGSDKSPSYKAYNIGDEVTYNNVDYYVIKDSGTKESTVTLLKAEPLTVDEVNEFGIGHLNKYANAPWGDLSNRAYDQNGYGGMAYYTSETCGYVDGTSVSTNCTGKYEVSEIKYVVDAWKNVKVPNGLKEARLITYDEFISMCDIELYDTPTEPGRKYIPQFEWMYNSGYDYWTMTPSDDLSHVWVVYGDGHLGQANPYQHTGTYERVVRPVIVLDKSVLPNE